MSDNRVGIDIDIEFDSGKKASDKLAKALNSIKKQSGELEVDIKFDRMQNTVIRDFAKKIGLTFSKDFANSIKDGVKNGNDIIYDVYNETLSKINKQMSKDATDGMMKQYKGFINEIKGMKFSINNIAFDQSELNKLKSDIRGTLGIDKNAIGVDSLMEDIKSIGQAWGFAFDSDVIQDNVIQLGKIISEYKNLKKNGVSAGLSSNEEAELLENIAKHYGDMLNSLDQLENAKKVVNTVGVDGLKNENKLIKEQLDLLDGKVIEKGNTKIDGSMISEYEKIEDKLGNIHTLITNANGDIEKTVEPIKKLADAEEKFIEAMAKGREKSEANAKKKDTDAELKQAQAVNKALEDRYKLEQEYDAFWQKALHQRGQKQEDLNASVEAYKTKMIATIKTLKSQYESVLNSSKGSGYKEQLNDMEKAFESFDPSNVRDFNNEAKIMNAEMTDLSANIRNTGREWSTAQKSANSFSGAMKDAMQKIGIFSLAYEGLHLLQRSFRDGIEAVKDMDSAMTTLKIIMEGMNDSALQSMSKQSQELATSLSSTTSKVLEAVTTFANVGETLDSIMNKTGSAIILSNLTGLDTQTTVNTIQSATKQFEELSDGSEASAMKVTDSMVAISKALGMDFSLGVKEMSESISILGSLSSQLGGDLDDTLALIAGGMEKLRLSGLIGSL